MSERRVTRASAALRAAGKRRVTRAWAQHLPTPPAKRARRAAPRESHEPPKRKLASRKARPASCPDVVPPRAAVVAPKEGRPRRLYLDQLPLELCTRIAVYVSNGKQCDALLNLAETSDVQRRAVVSALQRKVAVQSATQDGVGRRWAAVFADDVCELDYNNPSEKSIALVKARSLRSLRMVDNRFVLQAVGEAAGLKELELVYVGKTSRRYVLATLKKLNLERLKILCLPDNKSRCLFKEPKVRNARTKTLAHYCPNVRSLRVACLCYPWYRTVHPIWGLLSQFPLLQDVSISENALQSGMPPDVRQTVRSLGSVRIDCGIFDSAYRDALDFGKALTAFHCHANLDADQLAALSCAPKLVELCTSLANGAEKALGTLVHSLPDLKVLELDWGGFINIEEPRPDLYEYCVPAGSMLDVVSRLPDLVELRLVGARFSLEEITSVLKWIGPRLKRFETWVAYQDEPEILWAGTLLQYVNRYNTSLSLLSLANEPWLYRLPLDHETLRPDLVRKVRREFRTLQRRLPMLDPWALERYFNWLLRD